MNKLTKYTLIATIVAVGVVLAFHFAMWLILNTVLELVNMFFNLMLIL